MANGRPVYDSEFKDWLDKNPNATGEEQVAYEGELRKKHGMSMTNERGDSWDTTYINSGGGNDLAHLQGKPGINYASSSSGGGGGQDQVFGGMFNLKGVMDAFYQ